MSDRPEKICEGCGRPFAWRKKWARSWADVRYCSDACRRRRNDPARAPLERAILDLLSERKPGATICPSEAARQVSPGDWRQLMEPAREAARRLARDGKVRILQGGKPVDAGKFHGPIRIGRPA